MKKTKFFSNKSKSFLLFVGILILTINLFFPPRTANAATYPGPIKIIFSGTEAKNSAIVFVVWTQTGDWCFNNYEVRIKPNGTSDWGYAEGQYYHSGTSSTHYLKISYYTEAFQGPNGDPVYLALNTNYDIEVIDNDCLGNNVAETTFTTNSGMNFHASLNSPTSVSISWDSTPYTDSYYDYHGGLYQGTIYRDNSPVYTVNSNSGTWLDTTITQGHTYKYYIILSYRIYGPGMGTYESISSYQGDETITIPTTNSITIISPIGSAVWQAGTTKTISWSSNGDIGNVKIELYNNNVFQSTIISSTSNVGSYTWTIPSNLVVGSNYKIRITDTSSNNVYDDSNSFTIAQGSTPGFELIFALIAIALVLFWQRRRI